MLGAGSAAWTNVSVRERDRREMGERKRVRERQRERGEREGDSPHIHRIHHLSLFQYPL
jgi:hypothetical protein